MLCNALCLVLLILMSVLEKYMHNGQCDDESAYTETLQPQSGEMT